MIHCSTPTPPTPEVSRENPKETDPDKQEEKCQAGIGTACSKDKKCQKICDDLFSSNSQEKACLELPKKTVLGFEELFETLEEEDPDDLDLNILECLLDIDDTEFANAVKKLSKDQAKAFLIEVTEEEELSRILEEEDDAFNILKQAFSRAGFGYKLKDVLTDELEDDKSFFHIVAEDENKPAYKWIDAYVEEVCEEKRDRSQCPGEKREKLGAYCQAFINHYSSELAGFLSSADLFEDDYRKKLEREDEAWTVSGFKDFCRDKYNVSRGSGSSSSNDGSPTTGSTTTGTPAISREDFNRICSQPSVDCEGVTYETILSLSSPDPCNAVGSSIPSFITALIPNYAALERLCQPISGFCDRTAKIRDAILRQLSGVACEAVSQANLNTITSLDLSGSYTLSMGGEAPCTSNSFSFNKNDFKGLDNLVDLDLSGNCIGTRDGEAIDLTAPANKQMFSYLPKIRRIDLTNTAVNKLPRDFFTAGNLRTLDDEGVTVSSFVYCGEPESPYKSKLKASSTGDSGIDWVLAHNDPHWGNADLSANCY